jgi:pentatricopeptide repeat protein
MGQNALVPDQTTYSIMVDVLSKHGYGQEALDFLMEMEDKGFSIDVVGYSAVINAFCGIGKMDEVKYIVNEMFSKGCIPDVATYSTVINGFCRIGIVDEAMRQESCFAIWSERVTILIL